MSNGAMTWRVSKRVYVDKETPRSSRVVREGRTRRELNLAISACISGLAPLDQLVIEITGYDEGGS